MKSLKIKVNYITSRLRDQLNVPKEEIFLLPEGSTYEDFFNVFTEKHDIKGTDIGIFSEGQNVFLKLKDPITNFIIDIMPLVSGG